MNIVNILCVIVLIIDIYLILRLCNTVDNFTQQDIIKAAGSDIFKYQTMIKHNMKYKLNNSQWVNFIDKNKFKDYASKKGLKTFKTLITYDQASYYNINFENLPNSFVLKSNKGSGRNIIVKDKSKMNKNSVIQQMKNWGSLFSRKEMQYEYITPKIIIEEYIDPIPDDIKIWVHNHKISAVQIHRDRVSNYKTDIYDIYGKPLPRMNMNHGFGNDNNNLAETIIKEGKWDEMINLAKKLAEDVDLNLFRVDMYYVKGEFYAGEITLSPAGGQGLPTIDQLIHY